MGEFDAKSAQFLDEAYLGMDFQARRRANFAALDPRPGEAILDVGCGTGHLAEDLSRAVGPKGRVLAIDPSPDMREAAADRCGHRGNIAIAEGGAARIPAGDATLDAAIALQVFEYVPDVPAALGELMRVLRPGGRLVISAIHWDSFIWHSDHPERMRRMMQAYDTHMLYRALPEALPGGLGRAGFACDRILPLSVCDTWFKPDGFAALTHMMMARHARRQGGIPEAEIAAWAAEQHDLAAAGRFFFSVTHFIAVARKPG